MKTAALKISLLLLLLMTVALKTSVHRAEALQKECARLSANERSLLIGMQEYHLRDSLNAASVAVLTLRASQIEAHLETLIWDMGVKLKRVESLSRNVIESSVQFDAPLKDTLVNEKPASTVFFNDGHISLHGIVFSNNFVGKIVSRDTLTQVVHRVPRRILFIKYGTKELRQEIVSSNPHSRIVYSEYIRVM